MSRDRRQYRFAASPRFWAGAMALTAVLAATGLTPGAAVRAPEPAQTIELDRLMRQKLDHSQALLSAVVTSNWLELQRHSEALAAITADPAWTVLKTPEYATQSQAYVRALQDLVDAAKRRDLDDAPVAYMALTLRCVQCHRYVARARVAVR